MSTGRRARRRQAPARRTRQGGPAARVSAPRDPGGGGERGAARAAQAPGGSERADWQRIMRRLRVSSRVLAAVLAALAARAVLVGPTVAVGVSAAVVAVLLLASLMLSAEGRRLAPSPPADGARATAPAEKQPERPRTR